MKNIQENDEIDFWPSITDLAMCILLVLLLFILSQFIASEEIAVLDAVARKQEAIVRDIAKSLGAGVKRLDEQGKRLSLDLDKDGKDDVFVRKEGTLLRFKFSNRILFEFDKHILLPEGKRILMKVGDVFRRREDQFKEIQIQGHTDTVRRGPPIVNWRLGALRSLEVVHFFQNKMKIDPEKVLISATTYGEYKPAEVREEDIRDRDIRRMNAMPEQRENNRRIEVLLIFPDVLAQLQGKVI